MVPIEYIRGLQTAELTEILIPGEEEEETESLRQRYFASFDETAFRSLHRRTRNSLDAVSP